MASNTSFNGGGAYHWSDGATVYDDIAFGPQDVFSADGQWRLRATCNPVDISALSSGFYWLQIVFPDGVVSVKSLVKM